MLLAKRFNLLECLERVQSKSDSCSFPPHMHFQHKKKIFMVLFFGKHFTLRHPPLKKKKSGSIQPDLAGCTQQRLQDCYKSML